MATDTRFAVIGAGSVGQSTAGDLILRKLNVSGLYDRFPEFIEPIQKRGGIECHGPVVSGFAPIKNATMDMAQAVNGADVVIIDVVADAHDWIATQLAPLLKDGQIVLLHPGYLGGTLCFQRALKAAGLRAKIDLAETDNTLYGTRLVGPGKVGVRGLKKVMFISALPASRTDHVVSVLKQAFQQLQPMTNVLEVGFHNTNPYAHAPFALLNWARIEQDTGLNKIEESEWVTPMTKKLGSLMDAEKMAVLKGMGLQAHTKDEIFLMHYRGEKMKVVPDTGEFKGPVPTIPPRYVTEDVPSALVPMASIARKVGVPTPVLDLLINLASLVKGVDYWKEGRTLEKMGLADKSIKEILAIVNA